MSKVIYFDAYCVLCNKFIKWVIKHDHAELYKFSPLDSARAMTLKEKHPELKSIDSVILEEDEKVLTHGAAVKKVLQDLSSFIFIRKAIGLYPDFLLLWGYKLVASSRYKIFGKYDACPPLPPEWRGRFI
jgi:predicted DCC family thiol-disulfide oxidoreductase YuxK